MKSVVLCGSSRFKPQMRSFAKVLKEQGVTVYEPYLHTGGNEWEQISGEYQRFIALGLTHDHFYKIKMADVVFIFNPNGYVGNSTTLEIGYAMALGKSIYAMHHDEELCRDVLFRELMTDPEELVKKLQ